MGFSATINEAIILIASIVLASGFSAYAIYAGSSLQSNVLQNLDAFKRNVHIHAEIGYATINDSATPKFFVIYVKNTGTLPITDFSTIDVYAGEYGKATLYPYNEDATLGSGEFR